MKKAKTPTAVITAVLTLITLVFWAGFEVYRSLTTKPAPSVPPDIISPLDPSLDTNALSNLTSRLYFSDSDIGNIQIQTSPTPLPTVVPTATPTASPTATSSGEITSPTPSSSGGTTP